MTTAPARRALISVSDKSKLVDWARQLVSAGYELASTGGTRQHLESAGLPVTDVSSLTRFPEMLDGRVKTLHPAVFGGILARHDRPDDLEALATHGIKLFDLVIVNLYPFEQTIAKPGVQLPEAIEQIDIGGPSLVRAAAKNHAFVTIVTDPAQYEAVAQEMAEHGGTTIATRRRLAAAAYAHTSAYDAAITAYLHRQLADEQATDEAREPFVFPQVLPVAFVRKEVLRYGENPHQRAAFYVERHPPAATLATAEQRNGKELSYNNLLDLDSALGMVRGLPKPACVVIKHNNPCGGATADALVDAFRRAYDGDPLSAFGGVLAFNRTIDLATAEALAEPGRFIEAIVAPGYDPDAFQVLTTKPKWKANVRLLAVGPMEAGVPSRDLRRLDGGLLVQDRDVEEDTASDWKCVTEREPNETELRDLQFGWHMVRHVRSNAIVVAKGEQLLGVGAGQMSRVDSVEIAIKKAAENAPGGVLASDAFFPFPDSIEAAAAAGLTAVIEPGGSKQDAAVIDACNKHGIAMLFTGRRHFKH